MVDESSLKGVINDNHRKYFHISMLSVASLKLAYFKSFCFLN